MTGPQISMLPDGRRLHMNHGPIDLIVEAFGAEAERRAAYSQATDRFRTILEELVAELPSLRSELPPDGPTFQGSTARRMERAVRPYGDVFVTPMAAVAGAVADEVLAALVAGREIERAYTNNGGDCAIHLAHGSDMALAIAGTGHGFGDRVTINADSPVRGVATSGWRGRSFSFGIADAVTVLAHSAAAADVAATLIANAVDMPGHPAIQRHNASDLDPDTDLGDRLVTVGVGPLEASEARRALANGFALAEDFRRRGLIHSAALFLDGESLLCGTLEEARMVEEHA
ncbi:MAG: UPF0280 family protein [Rhizobiaceae bacterium]|nr:UPF0280 family protein [Rhizobiaceae bacterium]